VSALSTMPFGKHKGSPLSAVPGDYLTWLAGKLDELRDPFRTALVAELARRASASGPTPPAPSTARREADAACVICGLAGSTAQPLEPAHRACVAEPAL
jgi:hypothetical protein